MTTPILSPTPIKIEVGKISLKNKKTHQKNTEAIQNSGTSNLFFFVLPFGLRVDPRSKKLLNELRSKVPHVPRWSSIRMESNLRGMGKVEGMDTKTTQFY